MTPEEDEANTRLRLLLLKEQLDRVQDQIEWEIDSFALRNPRSVVE